MRPACRIGLLALGLALPLVPLAAAADADVQARADAFLDLYSSVYRSLYTVSAEAEWAASTDVSPEHDGGRIAAGKAMAGFVGDRAAIETARDLLQHAASLDPRTVRQLRKVMLLAGGYPGTLPGVVARRVEAEARQSSLLDSWQFCLHRDGDDCTEPVTANDIDDRLVESRDLAERLRVWEGSKEIGAALRPGLAELRDLRNQLAREMGFSSFFDLEVADYGMSVDEMMALLDGFLETMRPLYDELHLWTRRELAARYGQDVPGKIPAHWLGNRWAQSWPGLVDAVDLDRLFAGMTAEEIVKRG